MRRTAAAIALFLAFVAASARDARADDLNVIQAVVTAYLTQNGVQMPGVFRYYELVRSGPYATVGTSLGTSGYDGMSFALSKTSGTWKILLHGGGLIGPSEFIDVGIPKSRALDLAGSSCGRRWQKHVVPAGLLRRALRNGPSAIPKRTIDVVYRDRTQNVTIVEPLESHVCVL
ncbi:MAG: hypothetical protein IAI48_07430 [Candidatus Eremiobacteraeota bacterium]|nr:hypothetical protein [Candidatus Eremiobacteraeota bacterium]